MRNPLPAVASAALLIGLAAVPAHADDPNQGNDAYVLEVDNTDITCDAPTSLTKVEGGLTDTISIEASSPIDKVTVKSGSKAQVVSQEFGQTGLVYWADIELTQDVSNYVAWTCPATSTIPPAAPTTPVPAVSTTTPATDTPTTPVATTTVPGGNGGTVPGVGAPDTGASGDSSPTVLLGSGLLLIASGTAGAFYLRRRAAVRG